jgi:cellulose synthase/poly-beta-1,6-N-acetylglucosamine synthase-like glycosyltransferase
MTRPLQFLFWFGIAWLLYVYLGYPVLLFLLGLLRRPRPTNFSESYLPKVSVLISARNEEKDIAWKIAETLSWDYPHDHLEVLVASDASEDGTDKILSQVCDPRFRFVRLNERRGKNEALNRLNELAHGDLLFFTDANSHIEPQTLRKMVHHFVNPRVGCVTGSECTIPEDMELVVRSGTRAFLGYESFVNTLESRLGSVLVCDGSIFAIRKSLFSALHPDLANDFELPVRIGDSRRSILFDPLAISYEKATSDWREEFRRKRRICCQGAIGSWKLRHCLFGFRGWQFLSRKLLRWLGVFPLALSLVSSGLLVSHAGYAAALELQVIFYLLTFFGWLLAEQNRQGSRATSFPFYFVMVNIAALTGVLDALGGKRFTTWDSPAHSRGSFTDLAVDGQLNRTTAEAQIFLAKSMPRSSNPSEIAPNKPLS